MRFLVTGGTGFVGTYLIQLLKSRASHIAVLASGGRPFADVEVEHHEVDIRDPDRVQWVVRQVNPDRIFHLAAISAPDICANDPRLTYEVNVFGAYNLFSAAMNLPSPPKLLNVSTSQVYAPSSDPLTEESPLRPENPYAASKAMAELLAMQYFKTTGGRIVTARAFNHTGPGQSAHFVLPSIARQFSEIQSGKRPPTVALGNIEVKRDFTDVRDVVRAYSALLDSNESNDTYNVSSGSAIRLGDILELFQSLVKVKVTIVTDPTKVRPNEVPEVCGSSKKLREATGWYPQISLTETITDLVNYWRSNSRSGHSVIPGR